MGFGPEFLISIFIEIGDLLDSSPAENGVVADKGSDIAVGNGVLYGSVNEVCEEGNTG
jgi:hypothetical protein